MGTSRKILRQLGPDDGDSNKRHALVLLRGRAVVRSFIRCGAVQQKNEPAAEERPSVVQRTLISLTYDPAAATGADRKEEAAAAAARARTDFGRQIFMVTNEKEGRKEIAVG